MQRSTLVSRAAIAGLVVAGLAASGCSWFSKTDEMYAMSEHERPLEIPPDLDRPNTDAAMAVPGGSVTASQTAAEAAAARGSVAAGAGFLVPGSRESVFSRVGEALEGIDGVEIASRAELLGAYDVNYQGSNFLVRVSEVEGGGYVSAVDPRGTPETGPAASQLIASLKGALGSN